jgi:hypothetical protein
MTYRSDLEALAARHDALASEVAQATRERDLAAQLLADAQAKARLPILDHIRVATPCRADWNAMTGDDRVRACGACHQQVFNLSDLTRDEAEALVVEHNGRLCVRYFQRADGTILLADCTIGQAQRRRRHLIAAGAAALLVGSGAIAFERSRGGVPSPTPPMATTAPRDVTPSPPLPLISPVPGDFVMGAAPPIEPLHEVKGNVRVDVSEHRPRKR